MNFILEALVTTLLSLDYILYLNHLPSTPVVDVSPSSNTLLHNSNRPLSLQLQSCRAKRLSWSSLSSNEFNESEFQSTYSNNNNNAKEEESEVMFFASRTSQTQTEAQAEGSSSHDQSRTAKTTTTTTSTSTVSNNSQQPSSTARTHDYHCPPSSATHPDTYYQNNPTVFGQILRGDLPSRTLAESDRLVLLEDIRPRAPLHGLVIPKAYIGSVFDLTLHDLPWMEESRDMALEYIRQEFPQAYRRGDYRLVFHVPPFHSVHHLHLHVLAPLSQVPWYYRYIKYQPNTRWCVELTKVLERLGVGQNAVSYLRPPMHPPQWQAM